MKGGAVILLAVLLIVATPSAAYEVDTHRELSGRALNLALEGNPDMLRALDLIRDAADVRQQFPDSRSRLHTVLGLVIQGSDYEDVVPLPLHHFFDPITGQGLSDVFRGEPSPSWALGTSGESSFSRKALSQFMQDAYLDPVRTNRDVAVGRMFEAIGRIIHHLQDMAQPQHVRNDGHLSDPAWEDKCLNDTTSVLCGIYHRFKAPSGYEAWTLLVTQLSSLPDDSYGAVYSEENTAPFNQPRLFWTNTGKGIAEFTSRNFLSAGTLNRRPPQLGTPYDMKASALCNGAVPPCGAANLDSDVRFYPSVVDDQLRPERGGPNPYAAAESIFSYDFNRIVSATPVLTVNRGTFHYAHHYLLPRAVAYSAGFINFIFRGEMEVSPPAEGVYAAVDASVIGCGTPCGFRKIKLKLRNTTAGGETMGPGVLRAVAKFHRNACYRPDLSGMYGGPPATFLGDSCRGAEEIRVSAPISTTVTRAAGGALYDFNFGLRPIPIDATDVRLQLVYRGTLGQEDDAVAVTTVDIAEPNFFAVGNATDYAFDTTTNRYVTAASVSQPPYALSNIQIGFADVAAIPPIATLPTIAAGEHAQFAFIAPLTGARFWVRTPNASQWEDAQPMDPYQFLLREELTGNRYRTECPVISQRGLYRQWSRHYAQQAHGHRSAAASADDEALTTPKSERACFEPPANGEGGVMDLSPMAGTPYHAGNARSWAISF